MRYYQFGGDDISIDDGQDVDQEQGQDNSGYDELNDRFNELQDHYKELSDRYDQIYSRLNEADNFGNLMSSYDNDHTLDEDEQEYSDNASDGEPINWPTVNRNLDDYKEHYNSFSARIPTVNKSADVGSAREQIGNIESGNSYTATNKNSSATGKYQFLWSKWGDSIKKVTGVKDQKDFLNNPQAQEKYYDFYEKNYLMPQVAKIKSTVNTSLTDNQLAKLVHYRGAGGALQYLRGRLSDRPESYNMPISKYIGTRQKGGVVANSRAAQHNGLNNPHFDEMYFPNAGFNTFRGLDNGEPVHVRDQRGKYRVLNGPHDKDTFFGNVHEVRGYK